MCKRRWLDFVVYLGVRIAIAVVQALPLRACHSASRWTGWFFCRILRVRAHVVEENLRHAFPELGDAERGRLELRMWEHLFLMVAEVAHARRKVHISNWHQHIRFLHEAKMARVLLEERPKVIVSGHFGNFELSGYFLGLFGFPTYAVARPLDNAYLHEFLMRFRGATGQYLLPKAGSAKTIAHLLERGGTLALLGDQHEGTSGYSVEFFGRPASTHKAIGVLALSSGAPLIVSYAQRAGRALYYESGIEGIADPHDPAYASMSVKDLTVWYTRCLERLVRRAPEQYWWLHRRWKAEPPRRRLRGSRRRAA
jgi:KDO2-lipid IV(A) lauroyltransferase